jgi:hypothetical protein
LPTILQPLTLAPREIYIYIFLGLTLKEQLPTTPRIIIKSILSAYIKRNGLRDKKIDSWKLEEEEALPILKAAYDRVLNTWDTSNSYSNSVSKDIIGKAIRKYNIPRHKLIGLAKCFNPSRESNTEELLKLSIVTRTET